jgi:hypothetical protein
MSLTTVMKLGKIRIGFGKRLIMFGQYCEMPGRLASNRMSIVGK